MHQYSFKCFEDENGCGYIFSIVASMSEISNLKPKCPHCGKTNSVFRDFAADTISSNMGIKTLGSLAEKNASTMSEDQKRHLHEKHNEYRKTGPRGELPKGMKYTKE